MCRANVETVSLETGECPDTRSDKRTIKSVELDRPANSGLTPTTTLDPLLDMNHIKFQVKPWLAHSAEAGSKEWTNL